MCYCSLHPISGVGRVCDSAVSRYPRRHLCANAVTVPAQSIRSSENICLNFLHLVHPAGCRQSHCPAVGTSQPTRSWVVAKDPYLSVWHGGAATVADTRAIIHTHYRCTGVYRFVSRRGEISQNRIKVKVGLRWDFSKALQSRNELWRGMHPPCSMSETHPVV